MYPQRLAPKPKPLIKKKFRTKTCKTEKVQEVTELSSLKPVENIFRGLPRFSFGKKKIFITYKSTHDLVYYNTLF